MSKRPPALAHVRFDARRDEFRHLDLEATFERIYTTNLWGSAESVSGLGSAPAETRALRAALVDLLKDLRIRTLIDAPCGDFGWLGDGELPVESYVGLDVVEPLVARKAAAYGNTRRRFLKHDLTRDPLPDGDLLLCRDCLVHLSFANIARVLDHVRRSRITYLLTTTFTQHGDNEDIQDGDWRMLNLERSPFFLGEPLAVLVEGCTEAGGAYADKSLALWRVADLR